MKRTVVKLAAYYLLFLLLFIIQKPLFMLFHSSIYSGAGFGGYLDVIRHGMAIDRSMAGYLTVLPGLGLIARQWTDGRWLTIAARVYAGITAAILAMVFTADTVLYGFWGSKLDTTPLFYFSSSPSAAMASVSWWYIAAAVAATAVIAVAYYKAITAVALRVSVTPAATAKSRWKRTAVAALLTAALFIPIRGGFTVSTMNLSSAYFSADQRLNHAAVNPAFSLMYSALHQSEFADQFRFMDDREAHRVFNAMMAESADSTESILSTRRPDIYIIILESFSAHLMPSLGGEAIATGLDSIAADGLLWTNFYASSFRTDRALPAILSGYPGQPTTSIMKYVGKAESLPSIPRSLKAEGYDLAYYYGGDANFTNMRAYLVSAGFVKIVSDVDFPIGDRMSKWGVVDHKVFERCAADARQADGSGPHLTVVQTSSSHEPFDVPYHNPRLSDAAANAFAYTDSCVTAFVNGLSHAPGWDNTLVVIVPDHYGAYPKGLTGSVARHHIPLVLTGGALNRRGRVDAPAAQTDIAATLLAQLGVSHKRFTFSRDILAVGHEPFAMFTDTESLSMVTANDTIIYGLDSGRMLTGDASSPLVKKAKAFLQTLYDDLDHR